MAVFVCSCVSCNSPLRAYQVRPGGPVSFSVPVLLAKVLSLPCGRCVGCRLERSRQDAVRCVHEAQMHEANAFITLTYAEDRLSLVKQDWVDFMKRLRERVRPRLIRFFMCGEYGELYGRPHYHAVIFGFDFPDRTLWKKSTSGEFLYRSALLEGVWSLGHSSVGNVTFESAAYVARYVMKKELGSSSPLREIVDVTTGEVVRREHEFSLRSLKPGLGRSWLERYWNDVYPHGFVVVNGSKQKPSRYYEKVLAERSAALAVELAARREAEAAKRFDDNAPARLRVKEVVLKARVGHLKRTI